MKSLSAIENYEDQYLKLREHLKTHQSIWKQEVLNYFPNSLDDFNQDWTDVLGGLSDREMWQFETGEIESLNLPNDLKTYLKTTKELEVLGNSPNFPQQSYPSKAWQRVKQKKRHELSQLTEFLKDYYGDLKNLKVLDLGGGVGHLARILSHYEGAVCTSVDANKTLQDEGKKRIEADKEYVKDSNVTFCHHHFHSNSFETEKFFSDKDLFVGLHTCGDLAIDFFKNHLHTNIPEALNFGCCYLKLDPETQTGLSNFSKKIPFDHTKYSLTLATRGHQKLTFDDFLYKRKVKNHRYLLHLFLSQELGVEEFLSVGDSNSREYNLSFSEYATKKLKEVGFEKLPTEELLTKFFQSELAQKSYEKIYCADMIRWKLGRLLELDILFDRGFWLKEKGQKVLIFELFDPLLSPRNIGLFVNQNS
ncbi:MAG: methyltransferase [Bacteriovoracaceae bacterium]